MVVATFRPGTSVAGRTIEYDNGAFWITGGPQVTAAQVTDYDASGQLEWSYPGLREWAYEVARAQSGSLVASSGSPDVGATAARPTATRRPSKGAKVGLWIGGGVLGGVLLLVLAMVVYFAALRQDEVRPGLKIVYKATTEGGTPGQAQMDQTVNVLSRRLKGLGVANAEVRLQSADQISIVLPDDAKNVEQTLSIVGKTARLEFFKDDPQSRPVGPVATKEAALAELKRQSASKAEIAQLASGGTSTGYSLVQSPADSSTGQPEQWYVYKRPPAMTSAAVSGARAGSGQTTGRPNVLIDFTSEGSRQFQAITRELYRSGLLKNQPQTFAVVLDNVIESDPMIDNTDPALRDGISGGAEISGGNMGMQESKDLAFVLNTGALPVTLQVIQTQPL